MRKEKYRLKLAPEIESTTTGSRFKYKCSKNRILNEGEKTLPRSLYKRMTYQSEKRGKKEIILQNRSRSGPLLKGIYLHQNWRSEERLVISLRKCLYSIYTSLDMHLRDMWKHRHIVLCYQLSKSNEQMRSPFQSVWWNSPSQKHYL